MHKAQPLLLGTESTLLILKLMLES